jgi:NADH:ubiquinone reductase (H+-translocating)
MNAASRDDPRQGICGADGGAASGRRRTGCHGAPIQMNSYLAWPLWGMIHVFLLVGSRNRLAVLMEWLWAYVSFRRGARLITGSDS